MALCCNKNISALLRGLTSKDNDVLLSELYLLFQRIKKLSLIRKYLTKSYEMPSIIYTGLESQKMDVSKMKKQKKQMDLKIILITQPQQTQHGVYRGEDCMKTEDCFVNPYKSTQ